NPLGRLDGGMHGAEFKELEMASMETDAILHEKYWTGGIQLDGQCDQAEEWSSRYQPHDGDQHASRPSESKLEARLAEVPGENEVARPDRFEGELAREALVRCSAILNQDPSRTCLEERGERQATPLLTQSDDDGVRANLVDDLAEVLEWPKKRVV